VYLDFFCPNCRFHFEATQDTLASTVLDQVTEEGPWSTLEDGLTFEDVIVAAMSDRGARACPSCGQESTISEKSLGRVTMEVLTAW
jgi:predicted RNA-binding Zn-ribbon protein involved in translation (DUF1610 family)